MKSFTPLLVLSMLFFTATVVNTSSTEEFGTSEDLSDFELDDFEEFSEPELNEHENENYISDSNENLLLSPPTGPGCKKYACNMIKGKPDWVSWVIPLCKDNYKTMGLAGKYRCETAYCNKKCVQW